MIKFYPLVLKYICFTVFCPFNLTPSKTGMTGWNGCKTAVVLPTHMIHRSESLFCALKCMKLALFLGCDLELVSTSTAGHSGCKWLFWGDFLPLWRCLLCSTSLQGIRCTRLLFCGGAECSSCFWLPVMLPSQKLVQQVSLVMLKSGA